jgi:5-enolpyruvylshikimate-3-phosphate synthase
MAGAIVSLGADVTVDWASGNALVGPIERVPENVSVDCGESGTAARFLIACAGLLGWPVTITGRGTLLTRTMAPFVESLCMAGARVDYLGSCEMMLEMETSRRRARSLGAASPALNIERPS